MNKNDNRLRQNLDSERGRYRRVTSRAGLADSTALRSVSALPQTWATDRTDDGAIEAPCRMAQDRPVETLRVGELSDAELQSSVESALERDVFSPDTVSATVHNGVVTLEGEVTWIFERDAAERTVQFLKGVAAVNNTITIKPQTSALQVKVKIQSALQRQATNDANSIHVETSGATVTLTGHASSWQAIEAAASAARAVAGVTTVIVLVKMRMTY